MLSAFAKHVKWRKTAMTAALPSSTSTLTRRHRQRVACSEIVQTGCVLVFRFCTQRSTIPLSSPEDATPHHFLPSSGGGGRSRLPPPPPLVADVPQRLGLDSPCNLPPLQPLRGVAEIVAEMQRLDLYTPRPGEATSWTKSKRKAEGEDDGGDEAGGGGSVNLKSSSGTNDADATTMAADLTDAQVTQRLRELPRYIDELLQFRNRHTNLAPYLRKRTKAPRAAQSRMIARAKDLRPLRGGIAATRQDASRRARMELLQLGAAAREYTHPEGPAFAFPASPKDGQTDPRDVKKE